MEKEIPFNNSVFINSPIDNDYNPLLKAVVFVLQMAGLEPQLATDYNDGSIRIDTIERLIQACKYSIHDLSRMTSKKKGEFARMNMSFELGLDYGCKKYSDDKKLNSKKMLVLDKEKYRYQKALSDFSGIDISAHKDDVLEIIKIIRDWIDDEIDVVKKFPGTDYIWGCYNTEFQGFLVEESRESDLSLNEVYNCNISQFKKFVSQFFYEYEPTKKYNYFSTV